jgi:hypothetical protein
MIPRAYTNEELEMHTKIHEIVLRIFDGSVKEDSLPIDLFAGIVAHQVLVNCFGVDVWTRKADGSHI